MNLFTLDSCLQVIQDTCRELVRRDAKSRNRADAVKAKAKALADQVPGLEAQVKELEAELESSRDSIIELKKWVRDREAEIANKAKYIALLEECLAKSTAVKLRGEGQLRALWMQLGLVEDRVMAIEAKAITVEAMVGAVKRQPRRLCGTKPRRSLNIR